MASVHFIHEGSVKERRDINDIGMVPQVGTYISFVNDDNLYMVKEVEIIFEEIMGFNQIKRSYPQWQVHLFIYRHATQNPITESE